MFLIPYILKRSINSIPTYLCNCFIKDVFNYQGRVVTIMDTRVRVNALLRIARDNKVLESLNYIIDSDRINKDVPKAIEMAKKASIKLQLK